MRKPEIQKWLRYWGRANMIVFDEISTFKDMSEARRFCKWMNVGLFYEDLVSTEQLFEAFTEIKSELVDAQMRDFGGGL